METLFEQQDLANSGKTVFYITNHYNLREILASRFIGNLYSYDGKYYNDFLADSSGHIPFFTAPFSKLMADYVNEHDRETSTTVCLEILQSCISETNLNYLIDPDNSGRQICLTTTKTVPLKDVKAIHFLSEGDKKSFQVRSYSNLSDFSYLFKVTPQLIGTIDHTSYVLSWLRDLKTWTYPDSDQYKDYDKMGGAISLGSFYLNKQNLDSDILLSLLNPISKKGKNAADLPIWLQNGLHPDLTKKRNKKITLEEILFLATIKVLYKYSRDTVNLKDDLIQSIVKEVEITKLPYEDNQNFEKSISTLRKYLKNEKEFVSIDTPPGFEVQRALLLFLMRTNYQDLLTWPVSQTGANNTIMLTALIFSGLVYGFKDISTPYRSTDQDEKIANAIVGQLNAIDAPSIERIASKKMRSLEKDDKKCIDDQNDLGLDEITKSSTHNALDLELVLTNCNDDQLAFLCKKMHWDNCVESQVRFSAANGLNLSTEPNQIISVKLTGVPEIKYEINRRELKNNLVTCDKIILESFLRDIIM